MTEICENFTDEMSIRVVFKMKVSES